ncbi:MAG: restriction endonuclease subunit S [Rhodospirillales bacterium]
MPEPKRPTPRLRFPEFRDAEPWAKTTIGEIGKFYYGKSAPKWSLDDDAPTPCVRYGELYTKFGPIITQTYSRTNIDPTKLRFSKGGEILVPRVGEKPDDFGKCCCFLPLKGVAIGEMISAFETKQNPVFYTYYFRTLYKEFAKVVEGQNVKNLYYAELEPLTIFRPSPPEQQKIGDCLTSLDDLIRAEEEAVEALRAHKTGLMQQLFPRAGETIPRLRFPEFRDAGPWEVKRLGEVCDVNPSSGERPPSFVYIDLESVEAGELIQKKTISRENAPSRAQRLLQKGDVIYQMVRPYQRNNLFFDIHDGKSYVASTGYALLRAKQSSAFLYHLVHTVPFTDSVLEKCTGSNYPAISSSDLAGIRVAIPSHLEQQKIADCLTSLDDLIRAREARLDALRAHKTGLMQQLFPQEVG